MGLFIKKKPKEKELSKGFEVLNYTPADYFYTVWYTRFLEKAEQVFRKMIAKTDVDDLCEDMLDYFIDSNTDEMKNEAKEQYIHHMHVISRHKGLLDGKLIKAKGHLENIRQDLSDIEQEICLLKQIKKEKGIH